MTDTLATLRKPDSSDIEAILSLFEEIGDRYSRDEINKLLAAGLRNRLHPDNGLDDDANTTMPVGDETADTHTAHASSSDLAHHHFALPTHLGQGQLRTVVRNGEPWFVAADACAVLEIKNTTDALNRLDEDEKAKFNLGLSGGATNVINESGLFSLILNSRKPQAKPFKRWVTHEVLPSIARTGSFQDHDGAMEEHLRAATGGQVGIAPAAPAAPGLPPDLQMLLSLVLPLLAGLAPHLQDWLAAWLDKRTRTLLPRTRPAYADLPFFDLLSGRCKLYGRTFVARELGVSLPQISQVLNFSGRYGDGSASPATLAEKVLFAYGGAPAVPTAPTQTELPV